MKKSEVWSPKYAAKLSSGVSFLLRLDGGMVLLNTGIAGDSLFQGKDLISLSYSIALYLSSPSYLQIGKVDHEETWPSLCSPPPRYSYGCWKVAKIIFRFNILLSKKLYTFIINEKIFLPSKNFVIQRIYIYIQSKYSCIFKFFYFHPGF